MNKNDYKDYYEKMDLVKLIGILENSDDYNPIAIEVADEELKRRQISASEYNQIKIELSNHKLEADLKAEKNKLLIDETKENIKTKANASLEAVNPLVQNSNTTTIKVISGYFIIAGLYTLLTEFGYLKFVMTDETFNFSMYEYIILISFILPIIAGLLLWFTNKIGWYLSILICLIGIGIGVYFCVQFHNDGGILLALFLLFIHGGIIYYLFKPPIRDLFNVRQEEG